MSTPPPLSPIRLMIVDDSELVRMGLRTLLEREEGIRIVAEAANVSSAIAVGLAQKPDVILMDIRLPDGTGFEACSKLLEHLPATRVIFLTSVVDDKLVDQAIHSGGVGYLLKEINGRGLVQAVKDVAAGRSILDSAVTERVLKMIGRPRGIEVPQNTEKLSSQELRVLSLIAEGKTNKEVGLSLQLSEKTVKNYLANIFVKLGISGRTQAALYYMKHIASAR